MSYLYPGCFLHRKRKSKQEYIVLLQQRDLQIAALESLLEDKKREAKNYKSLVLRSMHRHLGRIESQRDRFEAQENGI